MPAYDRDLSQRLVSRITSLSQPLIPMETEISTKLIPLQGIRAVLFDIYGTLIISGSGDIGAGNAENDEQAFRSALHEIGISAQHLSPKIRGTELYEQAIRQTHEHRRQEGIEFPEVDIVDIWRQVLNALPQGVLAAEITPAQLHTLAVEYECRINPVWPMSHLAQTLVMLQEHGLVLGIVSNAQFYTPLLFEAFLKATPEQLGFDSRYCAFSYQWLEAKPSVRLYQRVLESLASERGIEPQEALYVGNDRLKDIWPAARLGCKTALFAGDKRSLRLRKGDERCHAIDPDVVIKDLRQLKTILKLPDNH